MILRRIERKNEGELKDDQFRFFRGRGTWDIIGCMKILVERFVSINKEIYLCFVDWKKVFDSVKWNSLFLKDIVFDFKDRRPIKELYVR